MRGISKQDLELLLAIINLQLHIPLQFKHKAAKKGIDYSEIEIWSLFSVSICRGNPGSLLIPAI